MHTEKRDHIMRHVVAYKSSRALMRGGRLREVLIIGALTKKMLVSFVSVVADGRRSLTRAGRTWKFDCIKVRYWLRG